MTHSFYNCWHERVELTSVEISHWGWGLASRRALARTIRKRIKAESVLIPILAALAKAILLAKCYPQQGTSTVVTVVSELLI